MITFIFIDFAADAMIRRVFYLLHTELYAEAQADPKSLLMKP